MMENIMAPKTKVDFDNMSDEDFLKLDESDFSGDAPAGQSTLTNGVLDEAVQVSNHDSVPQSTDGSDTPPDGGESDESDDDPVSGTTVEEEEEGAEGQNPMGGEGKSATEDDTSKGDKQPVANAEEEGKADDKAKTGDDGVTKGKETPAKAGYYKLPDGMETAQVDEAIGFFKRVTTPFKADGKDFHVRSPEDAIRLMQQGVNYSRRMQEIKPMKQLNRMLQDHGLDKADQLNFLIDLSKGDKGAITQLLKSHKIDPMDLDIEKDSGYQAKNYQGNPQDNDFRDALDMALTTPEGQALVSHIHRDWDPKSKARLREDPSLIGTLQGFKASGVYDKVVEELRYQQSLGYLQGVPFLQAFDQVGEAMKNAGVFNSVNPAKGGTQMAPIRGVQPQSEPLASGARKPQATKKPAANPHLSSTPPSKQTGNTGKPAVDFDKLSDEDFAKLPPPE
ncbi:N4 gp57-like protein [Sulfitobacter phage EE36phi1]|uniref:N4 gp57-like protein n=1 Tax=Sulfitobacter phage EE36phi1 TaxID=490913 RepID=C4NTE7_9CAUD|nr:tail length tape measure protein [Sulfitobacter phage EE36phi1]ACL81413.1 N4 gp57-like protein [Sulfitobacter phage EE36phi1]